MQYPNWALNPGDDMSFYAPNLTSNERKQVEKLFTVPFQRRRDKNTMDSAPIEYFYKMLKATYADDMHDTMVMTENPTFCEVF